MLRSFSDRIKIKESQVLAVKKRLETEFGVITDYVKFESIKEEEEEMDTT